MNRTLAAALVATSLASTLACTGPTPRAEPADLVLTSGRLVTLDPARPEASALAARGGRIVAVGDDAEIGALVGPATRVVDLAGRLAVPGLIEGHGHFASIGRAARILKLAPYATWDEIVSAVAEAAAKARPGEWIVGRGWHQEKWREVPADAVEGFPVHAALSAAAPDNPVLLGHASGHATMVNARALALAGIDRATPDPPGGEILHDAAGEPTGLLRESASDLVGAAFEKALAARPAEEVEADFRRDLEAADREVLSKGITSFHDAGETFEDLERTAAMVAEGRLATRLYVMLRDEPAKFSAERLARARRVDEADGHLTVRTIKIVADGALGSRGAWLLEPYSDQPGATGLAVTEPAVIAELAKLALAGDYQMAVHAIGDRANRETLDVFERAFAGVADPKALRWRVEHAQHLNPADIPRFAELGVIASMQGVHCTSDAPWVIPRLGEKRAEEGAYVWRKLVASGALIVNGTDAPVEDVDPIPSFFATVTRRLTDGTQFYPAQVLTRREALETYTKNSAWAAFQEDELGTLTPGKRADVTVLDRDLLNVPEEEILGTRAVYTIVGGRVLHEAPAD